MCFTLSDLRGSFRRSVALGCRPRKSPAVSGTSLPDGAVGLYGVRIFQRRYGARARSCRAPGVLSPGLFARDHRRTASDSHHITKGGIDGVRFPGRAGKGLDPFSHHAFDVRRAADAVPARRRATFAATRGCHLLRAPLDRSELAGRTSRRTPEPPWLGGFRPHRPDIRARLPSPSRHIYKPLTIAFAFPRLLAFGRFWQ